MLLKHLYDFAQSRHLLDDLAFAPKAVRWIIELDGDGNLLGEGPQITGDDKRGQEFSCPQTTRPKVAGGVSEFLADGLTAVFGLDPDPDAKMSAEKRASRDQNNATKQADFWRQVEEARKVTDVPDLNAVLAFRQRLGDVTPKLLRWGKAPDAKADAKLAWWLHTASGGEVRLGPENFTFRVNGRLLLENETLRQFWRTQHSTEVDGARGGYQRGLCLVSACENQTLAPTHNPKIKGVPNTQSFGATIVSFDKPAFGSYGFDQSLNAPTSEDAATAYCMALNWLLGRDDHSLRLGQTSLCFWAAQTEAAGSLFARLLNNPDPQSVAQFLQLPWAGVERELARNDQFFAVTLAGNSGRIVVRNWLQEPLDQAIEHFHQWFADLDLFVPPRPIPKTGKKLKASARATEFRPLSVYWLACTTVREAKDLAPDVPAQLCRAALEGSAPSISLIKPILDQLHSKLVRDENYQLLYDQSRFALLKLILNRNRKDNTMTIETKLTADTDDAAYNCGRLLAVFENLQQCAHEWKLEGATIIERYFAAASTAPMSAFGILWRLHFHHLKKLTRLGDKGKAAAAAIEAKIAGICTRFEQTDDMRQKKLPPELPRTLDLQAQGRFALGFYQQQAEDAAARQAAKDKKDDSKTETK